MCVHLSKNAYFKGFFTLYPFTALPVYTILSVDEGGTDMELPKGLSIAMDDDTPTLLLGDHGWCIAEFNPKTSSWEAVEPWLVPPGYARAVSEERIMEITGGVMPTEFHSNFE